MPRYFTKSTRIQRMPDIDKEEGWHLCFGPTMMRHFIVNLETQVLGSQCTSSPETDADNNIKLSAFIMQATQHLLK